MAKKKTTKKRSTKKSAAAAAASTPVRLLADLPVLEAGSRQGDGLGFDVYADVLADAAIGTPGPFTIGVFGEWGTGKTSLLRLVQARLEEHEEKILPVWFNVWRYEKEEHPIVPLVATILQAFNDPKRKTLRDDLKEAGRSVVNALRSVAYGFSAKTKIGVPGVGEVEAGFVAKEMIDRSDELSKDPLLDRSLHYQAFEKLSEVKLPDGFRIVVLVDDLDRCLPDVSIRLLESIKLVLNQPGFVFFLGVSRIVVEGYLEHRYEKEFGIQGFEGHKYLDKIVQLAFHIPPHRSRLTNFSENLVKELPEGDRQAVRELDEIIGAICANNPRNMIRFVNNLLIDRAINAKHGELQDEIPIGYFAVSRGLQLRWPDIYGFLEASGDLCQEAASWRKEKLGELSSGAKGFTKVLLEELVRDRDLRVLLFSEQGNKWLSESDARAASIEFLESERPEESSDPAKGPTFQRFHVVFAAPVEINEEVSGLLAGLAAMAPAGVRILRISIDDIPAPAFFASGIVFFIAEETTVDQAKRIAELGSVMKIPIFVVSYGQPTEGVRTALGEVAAFASAPELDSLGIRKFWAQLSIKLRVGPSPPGVGWFFDAFFENPREG